MKYKVPFQTFNDKPYDYALDDLRTKLEEFIPPHIHKNLYPYQREGIRKGIKLYGRLLINDDSGMGKTLQAISLSLAYKNEWPLIIICPSFVKYHWRYEILKWLPGFEIQRI